MKSEGTIKKNCPLAQIGKWILEPLAQSQNQLACTYGTAKKKRPGYLVGNLVATNWPIEKALHAIGYNQIPTK